MGFVPAGCVWLPQILATLQRRTGVPLLQEPRLQEQAFLRAVARESVKAQRFRADATGEPLPPLSSLLQPAQPQDGDMVSLIQLWGRAYMMREALRHGTVLAHVEVGALLTARLVVLDGYPVCKIGAYTLSLSDPGGENVARSMVSCVCGSGAGH